MKRWVIGGATLAVAVVALSVVVALPLIAHAEKTRLARVSSQLAAKRVAAGLDGSPAPATAPATGSATASGSASASATASAVATSSSTATSAPAPAIHVSAPIAIRAGKSFRAIGRATGAAPGETVTVTFEREFGSAWYVAETTATPVDALGGFSASIYAPRRGHCRVSASLEATASHTATTSATFPLSVVGPKVVALTFDDGPWPHSTQGVVNALKANDVRATFFEIGEQVKGRPDRTKLVFAAGNPVEVHTWHHDTLTKRSAKVNKADFLRCIAIIKKVTGVAPRWLRPPGGATNKAVKKTVKSAGLRQIIWTVDTLDWKNRNTSIIVKRTMKSVRPGGVVLMHDGGGPRQATVRAVPIVIRKLRAKGYDFVTLDELVALGYSPL